MLFFISFWMFMIPLAVLMYNNDFLEQKILAVILPLTLLCGFLGMLVSVSLFLAKYLP